MPPAAASNLPRRRCKAPVKAPFSWPKSSDAIRADGIAAQFTRMNAREARLDRLWIALAISSLPVPVSPDMRTVESVCATFPTCVKTRRRGSDDPTISSNIEGSAITSRNARILVPHLFFGTLAVLNVSSGRIPANDMPVVISQRLVTDQEPAILSVVPPHPLFDFEGLSNRESLPALVPHRLQILPMEYPLAEALGLHVFERKAGVFKRHLVRMDRCAVRPLARQWLGESHRSFDGVLVRLCGV